MESLLERDGMSQCLERVRCKAEAIWKMPLLRQYTDHTVNHSFRVIEILDKLCDLLLQPLTDDEAYVLLCSAFLHDIGMQQERFFEMDVVKDLYTEEEVTQAREEKSKRDALIRECHHLISEERIKYELGTNCLEREFIDEIALVSRGHTKEDLATYEDRSKAGKPLRLRLLAGLLRLADELDLDYRRVDLEQLKQAIIPDVSKAHWWKCHYVESVDVEDGQIRLTFCFSEADDDAVSHIVANAVLGKLKQRLHKDKLRDLLWPYLHTILSETPNIEPPSVSKRPVPEEVLEILKREIGDLLLQRAGESTEAFAPFASGTLRVAFGEHPENLAQHAEQLWHQGRVDDAIAVLERGVSLAPNSAPLLGLLADKQTRLEHWQVAAKAAEEAIRCNPGTFLGRLNLGIVLSHQGDYRHALDNLRIAELASNSLPVQTIDRGRLFLAVARCLAGLGDFWHAQQRVEAIPNLADTALAAADQRLKAERLGLASHIADQLEGFESREGQWQVSEPEMDSILGYWTSEPPFLYEYGSTPFTEGILLGGSSSWMDYAVECEFQILSRAAGFFVRADAYATTGLMMQFTLDKLRRHREVHSNYFLHEIEEVDLPTPLKRHEWHTARFELSGTCLTTYLDGQLTDEWIGLPARYASGKFGFRLYVGEFALYQQPSVAVAKMAVDREKDDTGA
ncbi:MAG: HD domain-containing protein [bacterium]